MDPEGTADSANGTAKAALRAALSECVGELVQFSRSTNSSLNAELVGSLRELRQNLDALLDKEDLRRRELSSGRSGSGPSSSRRKSFQVRRRPTTHHNSNKERPAAVATAAPLHATVRRRSTVAPALPDALPRESFGYALRHSESHGVWVKPTIESIFIPDVPILLDRLAKLPPLLFKLAYAVYLTAMVGFYALGVLMPLFVPFEVIRYTGAGAQLFASGNSSSVVVVGSSSLTAGFGYWGNASAAGEEEAVLPWAEAWGVACQVCHLVFCASSMFYTAWLLLMFTNTSALALLWTHNFARLAIILLSTVAYAAASGAVLPALPHALWLVSRTGIIVLCMTVDAISVTFRLRLTEQSFVQQYGSEDEGRGVFTYLICGMFIAYAALDCSRHFLVLFSAEPITLFEFGTGLGWTITNLQLVDSLFLTNMLFSFRVVLQICKTHIGSGTVVLHSGFDVRTYRD